tara:strand:+ start:12426 stop:13034 length:609 start_codon:yes stop_codon:yes gene_type:complete
MDLKTILSKGTPHEKRFRVGRGIGSGNGKTCGRGHKGRGQRSGASRRPGYEGGQMPIYRRLPKRGFTNARFRTDYTIINVDKLNELAEGATVDLQMILDAGLVSMNTKLLKVLGNGDITKKLTLRTQKCSKSAREKIEAAGGSVVILDERGREEGATDGMLKYGAKPPRERGGKAKSAPKAAPAPQADSSSDSAPAPSGDDA